MIHVDLQCSVNEFKEGMESRFWQDIKNQLEAWIDDVRDSLEDPDNMLIDKTLHRLGGNIETLHRVLQLPEQTLSNLEDKVTTV